MKPDRIGADVQRELARFGPAESMSEIVRAWPSRGWRPDRAATRGRHGWPATERSTWRRPRLPGRSSSRSSSRSCSSRCEKRSVRRRPRRCGSLPVSSRSAPRRRSRAVRGGVASRRPRSVSWPLRWSAGIEDENLRKDCCEGGAREPLQARLTAGGPGTLWLAQKRRFAGLFLMAEAAYTAKDITVLEGLEPVRLAPGHVYRLDGLPGPPPPRLRGRRQLGRRGHGGPGRPRRCDASSGQLGDRHRQRLGDPDRRDEGPGAPCCDGRADQAPRRRGSSAARATRSPADSTESGSRS